MAWKIILLAFLLLGTAAAAAILYGRSRWESGTRELQRGLETARLPVAPKTFDSRELAGVPAPVQRYFQAALKAGQPLIEAANVEHEGTFNMNEAGENWKPFTSAQRVVTKRPGFLWDARIAMLPGVPARVHDAYVAGEGILQASLFGLLSLADLRGTPELARGELMRYFAEAAWYPTALLPSQGVVWEAVDDASARATLKDGETEITLLFLFNANGLIDSIRADARGRTLRGRVVPTPWEGRWKNYGLRGGIRVPLEGEVAWILPEGPKPYWRGRITGLTYEFAR